jgi:PBP1b-binding outer membrane lipoprotein LpoB
MKYFLILILAALLFAGCSSSKESICKETTTEIKAVSVPVPEIKASADVPFDTVTKAWNEKAITDRGDTLTINITEKPDIKSPGGKPVLHTEVIVKPAPVSHIDTTRHTVITKQTIIERPWYQKIYDFLSGSIILIIIGAAALLFVLYKAKKIIL